MAQDLARVLAAAAICLTAAGCGPAAPPGSGETAQIVEVAQAEPAGDTGMVTATGALRRQRQITLSFRSGGTIQTLSVDDGYPVKKGQVLASLDPASLKARLEQAAAALIKAKRDAARAEKLMAANAMAQANYDDLKTALNTAQSAFDSAQFDLDGASIVSPVDGSVLTRSAQAGEVVQPSQAVVSVADDASPLLLRVPVPDRDALRLAEGGAARVRLQGSSLGEITGRITHVGAQAGAQSGAVDVDIAIPDAPGLRPGLLGTAVMHRKGLGGADAQRIPAEALLEANGATAYVLLFDAQSHRARRIAVHFLRFDGDDAVTGGLPAGALVITAGAGFVSDGQKVAVLDAGRQPAAAQGRAP